jgi:hypothetical protein
MSSPRNHDGSDAAASASGNPIVAQPPPGTSAEAVMAYVLYMDIVGHTRLATDQTHFYSFATSLLDSDLLTRFGHDVLILKLVKFANLIDRPRDISEFTTDPLTDAINKYRDLSTEKTTDAARRKDRQTEFIKAIDLL